MIDIVKKWTPTSDRVIVAVDRVENEVGGIAMAQQGGGDDKDIQGTVLAVGEGRLEKGERVPVMIDVGDRVLFRRGAGAEMSVDEDGKVYPGYVESSDMLYISILIEDSILAIL